MKILYSLLLAGQIVLLLTFGDSVIYAKSGIERWLPYLIILGGIPFSIYLLLKQISKKKKDRNQMIAGGSILVLDPLFGLWAYHTAEKDLDKNGKQTQGKVIETFGKGRNVKCIFTVGGRQYETFTKTDRQHKVEAGDYTTVIYSSRNPENNKIPVLE
jgi:hypothetical protein